MRWQFERTTVAVLLVLVAAACSSQNEMRRDDAMPASAGTMNQLTAQERAAGWRLLFDGTTTTGWRRYGQPTMSDGWKAIDGALTHVGNGGDIITTEQFANFELALEWMLKPGGNSGIFYRAVETDSAIYHSAPEMQVLDDAAHADGGSPLTSAGANYGLHPAPPGVVKPVGQWNAVRIVVNGNHVEHWLNGQRIVEYELGSADWKQRVAESKFNVWRDYGKATRGHIGLQDHGDWVAYRNIRIRVLQ